MLRAECKRKVQLDNMILSMATQGTFIVIGSTQNACCHRDMHVIDTYLESVCVRLCLCLCVSECNWVSEG